MSAALADTAEQFTPIHLRKAYAKYRRTPGDPHGHSQVQTLCEQWVKLDQAVEENKSLLSANVCTKCMLERNLSAIFGSKQATKEPLVITHDGMKPGTEVTFTGLCKCGSATMGGELHSCPYAEEIKNDSSKLCECCEACTKQCARDV